MFKKSLYLSSCLLFILLLAACGEDPIVKIPDANFKKVLLKHNPVIDLNGDGEIQLSEAQNFDHWVLDVSDAGISNLKGIEAFKSITALHCSHNNLETLSLSHNIALKSLICNYNPSLSNLSLTNNTELLTLSCSHNKLTTLKLSANKNLIKVSCNQNQIKELNLSANPKLEALSCENNRLTDLDLSKNLSLTYLHCPKNQLQTLTLPQNQKLSSLSCEENQLKMLNLAQNDSLIWRD